MGRYYALEQSGYSSPIHGGGVGEADGGGNGGKETPSVASGDSSPVKNGGAIEVQIAAAIRDHYKPAGQDDEVPTAPVSVAVALADKIDTLTAFYFVDEKPTGSKDPFALRRGALGVTSIVLENNVRLNLNEIIHASLKNLNAKRPDGRTDNLVGFELSTFIADRLKVYLRDKGHRHDQIDAVLTYGEGYLQDDLVLIVAKLTALEAFLKTDDGANLAAGYKRAANILKAEGKKGDLPGGDAVVPQKFAESKEKVLFGSLEDAEAAVALALEKEDFEAAMAALAELRGPIDAFFEEVTVNADDPALRKNRLALLQRFRDATAKVADFSKLEG